MELKDTKSEIERAETHLRKLKTERDDLVRTRYKELFNIETWHKYKTEYVYSVIAKESGLSIPLIKKIIRTGK